MMKKNWAESRAKKKNAAGFADRNDHSLSISRGQRKVLPHGNRGRPRRHVKCI
jgi:hypothetical protein